MKPKIFYFEGVWYLKYKYPARAFWLFRATVEETVSIKKSCVKLVTFDSFNAAIFYLKGLYKRREIA